jgi:hypothetical protein
MLENLDFSLLSLSLLHNQEKKLKLTSLEIFPTGIP